MDRSDPSLKRRSRHRRESTWQRFWRKRRMRALRNSSEHAVYFAVGFLTLLVALGLLLYFGLRDANLSGAGSNALPSFGRAP